MTMVTTALDASRFVHAWRRFRMRMDSEHDIAATAELLQQFRDMAVAFQQIAQNNQMDAEWSKLQDALRPVVYEISGLCSKALSQQTEGSGEKQSTEYVCVPRAAELLLLKKQRAASTLLVSPPSPSPSPSPRASSSTATTQQRSPRHSVESVNTTELRAEDFRSMLEPPPTRPEKLSIHALRQRIGLVDRHATQTSASESATREEQEALQSDMVALARELKQRTQTINETLVEDVKILDAVGQSAESNTALLDRENAVLKKQLASAIGLWTSLALVGAVVLVFLVTYFYIKLFSRRRW